MNNTFIFACIYAKYLWKDTEGTDHESSDREVISWEEGRKEKFPVSILCWFPILNHLNVLSTLNFNTLKLKFQIKK